MHDIGYYLISAAGVLGWVAVVWIIFGRRRRTAVDTAATDPAILQRLDDLDTRLAAVEKTLHEIP
ncbi:MAG TPA: hypothetical protein VN759_08700 [Pseudolysinimonas sp.]|nr:hypothetical protein [Pseudolysinimonas sp.]